MNDILKEVIKYRVSVKGTCVSTTHNFNIAEFKDVVNDLSNRYETYSVEFKEHRFYVTIPFKL